MGEITYGVGNSLPLQLLVFFHWYPCLDRTTLMINAAPRAPSTIPIPPTSEVARLK